MRSTTTSRGSSLPRPASCSMPDNRRRLNAADADVVWLTADPTLLAPRTATRAHRPWLDDDPVGTLRRMQDEREPLYREVADRIVGRRRADTRRDRRSGPARERGCAVSRCRSPASRTTSSSGTARWRARLAAARPRRGGRRSSRRRASRSTIDIAHPARRVPRRARRAAQVAGHDRRPVPWVRPDGPHTQRRRDRRRRRHGHRRRRLRRRQLSPRRARRARRHVAARHDRRRDRWQDRRQPAGGQEPGRRVLAAERRRVRARRARHVAASARSAAGTARWPSTTSSPATTCWR